MQEVGCPSVEPISCSARFVCDLVDVASGAFSTPTLGVGGEGTPGATECLHNGCPEVVRAILAVGVD